MLLNPEENKPIQRNVCWAYKTENVDAAPQTVVSTFALNVCTQ